MDFLRVQSWAVDCPTDHCAHSRKIFHLERETGKMLDDAYLNDVEGLENPTIEKMAQWRWEKLESQCPGLCDIIVHETPTALCVYRGE